MEPISPQFATETASSVRDLVERRHGGPVRLGEGSCFQASGRSRLFRFDILEAPAQAPRGVIAKRAWVAEPARFDPQSPQGPARPLFNEWAGLAFLNDLPGTERLVPAWLGGDRQLGLVVMEDLGSCQRLDQVLLASDAAAAEAALTRMSTALGRLHGLTAQRHEDYERLRRRLGPRPEPATPDAVCARLKHELVQFTAQLGVDCSPGALSDLDQVQSLFRPDHPYWTYLHGDPCPDNWLLAESGIRLIDFEAGAYGNALLDGVYGRILFPSCWCARRIPEPVVDAMDAAYRHAFGGFVDAALDDAIFMRTRVEACAVHTLNTFRQFLAHRDLLWGIATTQQRAVIRAALLCRLTQTHGHLESLGRLCGILGQRLGLVQIGQRSSEMPYFPAFRGYADA